MTVREILRLGAPKLRVPSATVTAADLVSPELQQLLEDMRETMRHANGAGLAAPQIGVGKRVCLLEVDKNPRYPNVPPIAMTVLINPVVTPDGAGWVEMYEGCLSVPGLRGKVRRPRRVRVDALGEQGQPVHLRAEGMAAAIIQHEVDHLEGVLFVDRVDTKTLTFLEEYTAYVPPEARFVDSAGGDVISRLESL